jgi:hypothetical protein
VVVPENTALTPYLTKRGSRIALDSSAEPWVSPDEYSG